MHSLTRTRYSRIAASVMAFMMLAVIVLSASFMAHEAGHSCEEKDCPVCACIARCEKTLHQIINGTGRVNITALPVISFLMLSLFLISFCMQGTPVSEKVRLNN